MSALDLGNHLRQLFDERKMSVTAISKKLEVTRPTVYKILDGQKTPELEQIIVIARELRVHPMSLMLYLFQSWEFPAIKQKGVATPLDAIGFIRDASYPDNTMVTTKTTFVKTWEIQNIGTQTWKNRSLVCVDGQFEIVQKNGAVKPPDKNRGLQPSSRKIAIPDTKAGQIITLSVAFETPDFPCTAISYWKMVDQNGNLCFPENEGLSCQVQIIGF